jgi:uncharacterized tellurite resistance protein B-like protein
MDQELCRKVCQLVAGIVVTDEDLDPKEEAFVERMLQRFGLDATERDVIFPLVDADEAAEQMKGLPRESQEEAMGLLIEAAAADGKVVPEELEYLQTVGRVLGLTDAELNRRLQEHLS